MHDIIACKFDCACLNKLSLQLLPHISFPWNSFQFVLQSKEQGQANGFLPLFLPQSMPQAPKPSHLPQLRPMADPFSSFGHNQQLKLRVKEALLAEREGRLQR